MSDFKTIFILGAITVGVGYLIADKFGAAIAFGSYLICITLSNVMSHLTVIINQLNEIKTSLEKNISS